MAEKKTKRSKQEVVAQPDQISAFGVIVPALPQSDVSIITPELSAMPQPVSYSWNGAKAALEQVAQSIGDQAGGIPLVVVEPPREVGADFAIACHRLASTYRKSPVVIAQELADTVNSSDKPSFVREASAVNGYLNFELDTHSLGNAVLQQVEQAKDRYGEQNLGQGKTVVIDCSSPNVAKFMSVGHLRSTVIGESLARIYREGGYTVIRDNHLGDWGTQFGMLGRAYELWGKEIPEIRDGTDPVKGLYLLYIKMHEEVEKEKAAHPDGESTLEKEGREWFARLEAGDPEAHKLLQWSTTQSLKEFQRVYDLLGSQFEYKLGESFYVPMLPGVVGAFEAKGLAATDTRGVTSVRLPGEHTVKLKDGTVVTRPNALPIKKSDGTSIYATRDLAALIARQAWFHPDRVLYVVGGEQRDYFQQVFTAFDELAEGQSPQLEHVYFGMVSLPEGKMSTRRGRVIFLEDVLSEAIKRAKEKVVTNSRDLTPEEAAKVARQVGVGSVIYMDLGQGRERNIKFDWDHALSLEGNSSPYIQYQHARAASVLRKASETGITIEAEQEATFDLPVEQALVKHLGKFAEAIQKAIDTNQPSAVAEYVYTTADLFSQFYKQANILGESDPAKRNTRLRLTAAAAQVIKNGLNLLGIEAPEKM